MKTLLTLVAFTSFSLFAAEVAKPEPKVRYKEGKALNFEELLIQGQLKRPEVQIVTGNENDDANGLLRLRENFVDRMAVDFGENIQ